MTKVLVVTYFFPPFSDSGVYRIVKFTKYMPPEGCDPVILCAGDPYALNEDKSLLEEIPLSVKIFRTRSLLPMGKLRSVRSAFVSSSDAGKAARVKSAIGFMLRNLFRKMFVRMMIPDMMIMWAPFAYAAGKKICVNEKINVIFATDPPSDYLVAAALSRRFGIPLVVDFRDSWTLRRYGVLSRGFLRRKIEKTLESRVLKTASAVVFVNSLMRERYVNAYPHYASKFHVITNGFDEGDFPENAARAESNSFILLHAGRLSDFQNPFILFQSLHELEKEGKISAENFKAVFIGDFSMTWFTLIANFHLEDMVSVYPYKSHKEIVKDMIAADALLLIGGSDPEITTGKLYEYLGANRPVLAIAPPEGEAARLVHEAHAGIVAPPDDKEKIKESLVRILNLKKESPEWSNRRGQVMQYSRKILTKQLCDLFDGVLAEQRKV